MNDEMLIYSDWRVLPMNIMGVKLYAVESKGYTYCYCDTWDDAQEKCNELNS